MIWVAIEDSDTYEISEFAKASEGQVSCLMDEYRVDKRGMKFHMKEDTVDGRRIIYEGVTYKGGFGYNLWVANKITEL